MTGEGTDWAGREHPRGGTEPRVVSLVPSITELLFDLGLGPFVASRTTFCVRPREAVDPVPRVGGTKTVRLDRLRGLAPAYVIVNVDENRKEDVEAIESFAPHVIVTHPLEPADNPGLYRLLGSISGHAFLSSPLVVREPHGGPHPRPSASSPGAHRRPARSREHGRPRARASSPRRSPHSPHPPREHDARTWRRMTGVVVPWWV